MPPPDLSGADWHKSSRSEGNTNCVELTRVPGTAAVRDSKNRTGPLLTFTVAELDRFLTTVKDDRFDG
ncbi:MAG: DUF397 domain-containing protein [Umezawaea sp.]